MTDETAKELAAAMNRLAAALESLRGGGLAPGIQVWHHGGQQPVQVSPGYQTCWQGGFNR